MLKWPRIFTDRGERRPVELEGLQLLGSCPGPQLAQGHIVDKALAKEGMVREKLEGENH
tara:strand:+ start:21325 stop:21501 length:177 start_codon:yes stop_codon:yes gene_type:complete